MTQKLLPILLALTALIPLSLSARDFTYTYEGQTITYTVIDEAARTCATKAGTIINSNDEPPYLSGGAGYIGGDILVLPAHPFDNDVEYTLKSISSQSFACNNIPTVILPNTIESIGERAFEWCMIRSIILGNSVRRIEKLAFNFCYLREISLPSSIRYIGNEAFHATEAITFTDLESLCSVTYESSNPCSLADHVYIGEDEIVDIVIPKEIAQISKNAFQGIKSLRTVTFESAINPVLEPYYTFFNTSSALKIYVPAEGISSYSNFENIANVFATIQSIRVDESEVTVDANTSKSVALVISPAENTDPDYNIEYSVNDIAEVKVVDGSVVITGVKEGTTELTLTSAQPYVEPIKIQVNVTKSPEPTGPRDFTYTYEGQTITYTVIDEAARTCTTKEGVYNWETGVWETGAHASGRVVLPAHPIDNGITYTLTQIAPHSFHDWIELTSIDIANEVTFIGQSAFNGCENLTSVSIPLMVYSIENETFSGCKSLSSVKLSNVGNIGSSAFRDCCGLKSISFSYGAEIGSSAFMGCSGLTELNLSNVTSIGRSSFADCTNLRTVVFSEAIQAVPEEAFTGCTSLEVISFPSLFCNITHIGNSAFSGCRSLKALEIPESVTLLEHAAFARCSSLKSVFFKSLTNPVESYCSPFINSNAELKVYVPGAAFEQYVNLKDANVYATIQSLEVEESEVTVDANTSKSVALVIAPSENTDPDYTIEYSINDIAEAKVVDGSVVITGVKKGTTELTLTSAQPGVEPLHINVTITEPASDPFDISGDGKVDVTDVVNIVDKIIHKTAEIATHDLNGDGKVDVSDIVLLVAHILNGADAKETASRSGEGVTVPVCFDMGGGFTAMQTDVVVAEGTTVENISINPAIARSHTLGYNEIEPGRYRVIIYSPANRAMDLEAGEPLFTLAVTGDEHIATEATLFVEAEVVPTGIDGVANEAVVESVSYFDLQGRRVSADATGVLIERTVFTDGTVTTKKVIR